jgi:cell division protein FtsI (penicillin-binding protein 3)
LSVQHIVRDEVVRRCRNYHAIAAGAVVLNVKTGEVVAMASVPDFDPNNPVNAHDKDKLNRMSAGLSRWARPSRASPPRWRWIPAR